MIPSKIFSIFKQGSRTYFYSSLFFPKNVRKDVFTLYSFVRVADDFVDCIPQKTTEFKEFRTLYTKALRGRQVNNLVIDSFVELMKRKAFDKKWVNAFLDSMEMDLTKKSYKNLDETIEYIYGSAEVIGLMMAKILDLPKEAYECARVQGRAMQYVNFIRDIREDLTLGRNYFPQTQMKKSKLISLELQKNETSQLANFISLQITQYLQWQKEAEQGYVYIPKRYLIPIKTAAQMYKWTATEIQKNPLLVYEKKLKPSVAQIMFTIVRNTFS